MTPRDDRSVPQHRIQIDGGPSFEVGADEDSLLRGALRAGVGLPHECSVGGCGTCRFELLGGSVETSWEAAPGLSDRERQRGKRLACQSRPLGDCTIRVRCDDAYRPAVSPRRAAARLVERRTLTGDMVEFSFRVPDAVDFRAGQYALLYPPGTRGARAYSMSNLPHPDGLWRFVIRRVPGGRGSNAMFDGVRVGDDLPFDGPYGHAWLRPGARDVVCVAGGSGIGPMLSVARGALAEGGSRRVHFFLGLRVQTDLGAAQDLAEIAGPRLTTTTVLSAPEASPDWHGATGFVHAEVERTLAPTLDLYDFYFAGPPPMVEAMQDLLIVRHRVPFDRIHFDRFV